MPIEFHTKTALRRTVATIVAMTFGLAQAGPATKTVPLVRAPNIPAVEFQAYARANQRLTYSQALDSQTGDTDRLTRLLQRAQEAWLAGSVTIAQTLFRQIADLDLQEDWRDAERGAIHYSLIRAAQATEDESERHSLIKRAIALDWNQQPDPSLFPPPLIEAYRRQLTESLSNAKEIRIDRIFSDYEIVRINGKQVSGGKSAQLRLPEGTYRISAFSDSHPPLSVRLSRAQLLSYSPESKPFITGDCLHPQGGESALASVSAIDVFYDADCLKRRSPMGWQSLSANQAETAPAQAPVAGPPINWPQPPAPERETSKRTWLWVGVSVLAIGAIYAVYRGQPQSGGPEANTVVKPVHRPED